MHVLERVHAEQWDRIVRSKQEVLWLRDKREEKRRKVLLKV